MTSKRTLENRLNELLGDPHEESVTEIVMRDSVVISCKQAETEGREILRTFPGGADDTVVVEETERRIQLGPQPDEEERER